MSRFLVSGLVSVYLASGTWASVEVIGPWTIRAAPISATEIVTHIRTRSVSCSWSSSLNGACMRITYPMTAWALRQASSQAPAQLVLTIEKWWLAMLKPSRR